MPRDERFIELFCAHSKNIVGAAETFRKLMADGSDREACYAEICRFEENADVITRDTIQAIHRTFITPFDRSQILDLIIALDDTVDLIKDASRRIIRYRIDFTPEMCGIADCVVDAATQISDAMPLLGAIGRNVAQLNEARQIVHRIESEADGLFDRGLGRLFRQDETLDYKLTMERVYDLIEAVVDRCEDVTDVIDGIIIEQV